jgi:hypothetical protein
VTAYRLSAWIVEHDCKYSGSVTTVVDLPERPTNEEAERLMWTLADESVLKVRPDVAQEHLRIDFVSVTVTLEAG